MSTRWEGIFCALFTPTGESGGLLEEELKETLRFALAGRVHGIMALGSTGEFVHLSVDVRMRVLEIVLEGCGSVPVMANISDVRPWVVFELARFSKQAGASAVSILPPYFYPLSQEDLAELFVRAGQEAELPLFLYNFPERTGNRIELSTIAAVAERTPVAGVKQSGADFGYHADLVRLGEELGFVVFTGADTRLKAATDLGVRGCVSGLANAIPEWVVGWFEAIRSECREPAERFADRLSRVGEKMDELEFPLNVAAAMEARGMRPGAFKPVVSAATRVKYERLVRELREMFERDNLRPL